MKPIQIKYEQTWAQSAPKCKIKSNRWPSKQDWFDYFFMAGIVMSYAMAATVAYVLIWG